MEIPAQKHAGMTIFNSVIPAHEPGSSKQSDSAQIAFSGGPRPEARGDDEFIDDVLLALSMRA